MLVEIQPEAMCWPVEFTNGLIAPRYIGEHNPPNTGAFYWGWTYDAGPYKLESRLVPRKKIVGISLEKTIPINLTSIHWDTSNFYGTHTLYLFYTDEHGILAVREKDTILLKS
jgi:hypothetical protein